MPAPHRPRPETNHPDRRVPRAKDLSPSYRGSPYGALNSQARAAIERHGLDLQLWDIDPQDWNRPGVSALVDTVVRNARTGRVSLMPDGGGNRSQSVAALAQILPTLKAKGSRFAALPGC